MPFRCRVVEMRAAETTSTGNSRVAPCNRANRRRGEVVCSPRVGHARGFVPEPMNLGRGRELSVAISGRS
jgi:hypothetical protein